AGTHIGFQFCANDTSNNSACSAISSFIVAGTTPPNVTIHGNNFFASDNSTIISLTQTSSARLNFSFTDDIDLLFMAKIYKENKSTNFLENTYISLLKDKIDDLNLLKEIEVFFLEKEEWKHLKKASERILLLDPNDLDSIYYLGLSYLNLNKLDKSKKLFERLVKLKPDFADAYYRLGLIYLKKKNYDRAQKLFEKTLDILPNHRDTLVHLKDLYKKNK
ncbi:hypothetical protein LCGC14_0682190, partial [marine sediment metagenome]